MNTVVWVMMAFAGHNFIPTMEFTTQEKCERAGASIKSVYDNRGWSQGNMREPWCVKVEK